MRELTRILIVTIFCGSAAVLTTAVAQDRRPVRTIEDGILDEITLFVEKLPSTTRVAIRSFSATDVHRC
jgi:hypothetical protein